MTSQIKPPSNQETAKKGQRAEDLWNAKTPQLGSRTTHIIAHAPEGNDISSIDIRLSHWESHAMLNMDMNKLVGIETSQHAWQSSPRDGVWRKPLAREDAERGHATSIVRFDAGSQFTEHSHPLGEEVFVLDGVFSDHTGDFDKGSYFRNPPGFDHAPFSTQGCTLFVKLHQFLPGDIERVCRNTLKPGEIEQWQDLVDHQSLRLHQFECEAVRLVRSAAKSVHLGIDQKGAELFVIEGGVEYLGLFYNAGAWLRIPKASTGSIAMASHCLLWLKTGHL